MYLEPHSNRSKKLWLKYIGDGNDAGTSLGQSTTEKISFHGVTPIAQPSGAAQVAAPAGGTGATAGAYDTAAHRNNNDRFGQ